MNVQDALVGIALCRLPLTIQPTIGAIGKNIFLKILPRNWLDIEIEEMDKSKEQRSKGREFGGHVALALGIRVLPAVRRMDWMYFLDDDSKIQFEQYDLNNRELCRF